MAQSLSFLIFCILSNLWGAYDISPERAELIKEYYWALSSSGDAPYTHLIGGEFDKNLHGALWSVMDKDPAIAADFDKKQLAVASFYSSQAPIILEEAKTKYEIRFLRPSSQLLEEFNDRLNEVIFPYQKENKLPPIVVEQKAAAALNGMCMDEASLHALDPNLRTQYQRFITQFEEMPGNSKAGLNSLKGSNAIIHPKEWQKIAKQFEERIYLEMETDYRAFMRFFEDHPELFPDIGPEDKPERIFVKTLPGGKKVAMPFLVSSSNQMRQLPSYLYRSDEAAFHQLNAAQIAKRNVFVQVLHRKLSTLFEFLESVQSFRLSRPQRTSFILHALHRAEMRILDSRRSLREYKNIVRVWLDVPYDPEVLKKVKRGATWGHTDVLVQYGLLQSDTYWSDREELAEAFHKEKFDDFVYEQEKRLRQEKLEPLERSSAKVIFKKRIPRSAEEFSKRATNVSLDQIAEAEREVHYEIKRPRTADPLFLEVGSVRSSDLKPYSVSDFVPTEPTTRLTRPFLYFGNTHHIALPTPDAQALAAIHIEVSPEGGSWFKRIFRRGSPTTVVLEPGKDYQILRDTKTGKFFVELLNSDYAKIQLALRANYAPETQTPPKIRQKHFILTDHHKLYSLIGKLREAGFTELSDALTERIESRIADKKSITLKALVDIFQNTGYYTKLPEKKPLPPNPNNPFQQWSHFLVLSS